MNPTEARKIVAAIIGGEEEAAVDGNAYLDPPQVEALRVALTVMDRDIRTSQLYYQDAKP